MSNNIYVQLWDVITQPYPNSNGALCQITFEFRTRMTNYITPETLNVITYPCGNLIQSMLIK